MAMGFQNGSRLRQLFELPPPYTTPGIGDGLPGAMQPNGLPIAPPMEVANRSPARMAFRGVGAGSTGAQPQGAPISTMPLDTPMAPTGLQAQPVSPMDSLQPKKAGFFDKDGAWRDVLGALADGMAGAAGGQPMYGPMKMRQRQQQAEWGRQDALRREDRSWAEQDRDAKLAQPQYFMSGRDRVMFDPITGQAQTIYDGPTDFEEYAGLMGLEPGSDDYNEAMQDFVLRSNGPTAQQGRQELEDVRQGHRVSLEGVRQGNRASLRQMPTYANLHPRPSAAGGAGGGNGGNRPPRTTGNVYAPILSKVASGKPLTAGEQQVLSLYGRGGRPGGTGGAGNIPTVKTPADAARLTKGTRYRTPDGRVMVR
ncbi:hypothetical protein [Sphingobium cupriresistens]|uniref:Uncharacterized protein n=1 Tax=Sphingobium cupriresistens TaxID=1132417 RepID=A0A8G2DYE5_9SPHN|nr:hypothetical protein [Sphingobium cupriresistens]RYM14839.1 hypothetical protein EWH12_00010 [Sphingobium cupriresistens]